MTPQEFSQKIKEKYPQYQNVDDTVLAQKIVEKYPAYKDKVVFETVETPLYKKATEEIKQTVIKPAQKRYEQLEEKTAITKGTPMFPGGEKPSTLQALPETVLHEVGAVGGFLGDVIGPMIEKATAPARSALNLFDKYVTEPFVQSLSESQKEAIREHVTKKLTEPRPIPGGKSLPSILEQVEGAQQAWETLKTEQPRVANALGDVANMLNILGVAEAPGAIKTGTKESLALAKELKTKAGQVIEPAVVKAGQMIDSITSVAKNTKDKFVAVIGDKNKLRSSFTNLPEEIYKRVENPEYATKVKANMEILESDTKNPYYNLAQRISDKTNSIVEEAKVSFREAAKAEVATGKTFDIGARLKEILDKVAEFKIGKDIKFDVIRNKKGQIAGYKLTRGQYSPYTADEIGKLNGLINDIMSARSINADQLLALDQKFGSYYNAIPEGATGPTPYHAAVMQLKEATEARISNMLSGDMKTAYDNYARMSRMRSDFTNKIVDAKGDLKSGAEQFLANLTNRNKGQIQTSAKEYSDLLGMDVVAESQAINDATKFMLTQAPTGGRVADVLNSYLFAGTGAGVGAMIAGPGGAAAGTFIGSQVGKRLTSPKFIGTKAIEESIGRTAGSSPQTMQQIIYRKRPNIKE